MMELETLHDRGFYLTKAKEHGLLEEVIAGTATMRSRLDDVIDECDRTTPTFYGKLVFTKGLVEHLGGYFSLLSGLSGEEVSCELGEDKEWVHTAKGYVVHYGGSAVTTVIMFGLWGVLPVVGDILATLICPAALIKIMDSVVRKPRDSALQKRRDEVLGPVYNVIDELDQDIGKCFIIEHYHDARPRFEQTYAALTSEERAPVNDYLFRLLGAGGMLGMDEIQLNDYLSGLLAPEAEGDA